MNNLILVRPSNEYIDEIRAYRQDYVIQDGDVHGVSGLEEYEDIEKWITFCRLMEKKKLRPIPNGWKQTNICWYMKGQNVS